MRDIFAGFWALVKKITWFSIWRGGCHRVKK
jgi:hypothetical protein